MTRLSILHRTLYRYGAPVALGPHRLLLRPRESRDLQLLSHEVSIEPAAHLVWASDVAGNAVATAVFDRPADRLEITARSEVALHAAAWPVFDIAAEAISCPFALSDDDRTDLGALLFPQHADPDGRLGRWAWSFVMGARTDTLSLLKDLCSGVAGALVYSTREAEGAQPPLVSLDRGEGACRDFAVLFAEAARSLGFGARLVSGYLHDRPAAGLIGCAGPGTTHAWAEVYLPGAGRVAFDPTNRSVGGADLIPVAVARDIAQVAPVSGSCSGPGGEAGTLDVEVQVLAKTGS